MDFHKLSNVQLYSIINSRHLDAAQKSTAEKELERRGLTADELQQLADELASRQHQSKWSIKPDSNVLWLVLVIIVIIILRQTSCK